MAELETTAEEDVENMFMNEQQTPVEDTAGRAMARLGTEGRSGEQGC